MSVHLHIKQSALDQNLPSDGELRDYLAGKDETAVTVRARPERRLVRYREPMGRLPKTLLVMPPMTLYEGAVKRVIPPLGLCYVAASLDQHGYPVEILDCIVEGINEEQPQDDGLWTFGMSMDRFSSYLREHEFDVIGFTMIYSSDLHNLYRCAELAKKHQPRCVTIAGGLHASIYTRRFLVDSVRDGSSVVDFVIRGEGERRLLHFLKDLKDGMVDVNADGLAGWVGGLPFINPQLENIEDLDGLPFPAYHKVPLEKYFAHNVPFSPYPRGKRVMQIYTSRGCPVGCTFCASTNFAKRFRARSPQNVMAEIEHHKRAYAIDEIQFADDNLTFDRERSTELFRLLRECDLPWCTPNGIMVNTLSEPLLDLMIACGMYQITLSIDSGSARTLKACHRKPVNLERVPGLMAYLQAKQVLMHGTLVVGMPGETIEDVAAGFEYVEKLPFHSINVFIAQAIPGSELFEKAMANGTITFEGALHIDTAKSQSRVSGIDGAQLEAMVAEFLSRYNRMISARDPLNWERKYRAHRERLSRICIGNPSPNTAAIIAAQ